MTVESKKKLDKWIELLLDTSKSNNLISFKDKKSGTVEILLPDAERVFEKIKSSQDLIAIDPAAKSSKTRELESEDIKADFENAAKSKKAVIQEFDEKTLKENNVLVYSSSVSSTIALKNIQKKAKQVLEETGVNVVYAAFGFIHWTESESSNIPMLAPVLLVPVQISRKSSVDPFSIYTIEEDIVVNPTFSFMLKAERNIELPEYDGETLSSYLGKVQKIVRKLNWKVTNECKLGIFSFSKINMYKDLISHQDKVLANPIVKQILGVSENPEGSSSNQGEVRKVEEPLTDLRCVVDADSSQIEAIEMAKSGKSFVLQGPPGTGKSQTITNIIAECLSDGKTVLFVSEKLAALNVVSEKLEKAGLSEFCLELHSQKANKKEVVAEICKTLRNSKSRNPSKAAAKIEQKRKAIQQLDAYEKELHAVHATPGFSLFQLYELYFSLKNAPDVNWVFNHLNDKGENFLENAVSLLEQYEAFIPATGYDYRKNPWYGYINDDSSFQSRTEVLNNFRSLLELLEELNAVKLDLQNKYGIQVDTFEQCKVWESFFAIAGNSDLVSPSLLKQEKLNDLETVVRGLQERSQKIRELNSNISDEYDEEILSIDGKMIYKKLSREYNNVLSKMVKNEYRTILKNFRLKRKSGKRITYQEAVDAATKIMDLQNLQKDYETAVGMAQPLLGESYKGTETDWNLILGTIDQLKPILSEPQNFGGLIELESFYGEKASFKHYGNFLGNILQDKQKDLIETTAEYFDRTKTDIWRIRDDELVERLTSCLQDAEQLTGWMHLNNLLSKIEEIGLLPYLDSAIDQKIDSSQIVQGFEKQFYFQWIDNIISKSSVLSGFNHVSQEKTIQTFRDMDKEQFDINRGLIKASLSSKRPSYTVVAKDSPIRILLSEEKKKRRIKPIRMLFNQTGSLVQTLKPCFMMSPLSVSTFLDPDSIHFDVVIFDEASQIFPQDSLGAIYRGNQLIVVGDSKQMPPSNFFNSITETDEILDDDDTTDYESILDVCSVSMEQRWLRWHYRSRFEQLIAFSNKNFYNNGLITFPSSSRQKKGYGVEFFLANGIYDRTSNTNRLEAEHVTNLVFEHIKKYPDRSLGVVTLNMKQQDLIERLVAQRRRKEPKYDSFFNSDKKEPFFIKNLETVQGDERDTIIFSITFGKDAQGRLLHNFGPLNKQGGERRLNVAITRAKCNIKIVSSMSYTDIDLKKSKAEGVRLLREYLDFAENGDIALSRSLRVDPNEYFDSDFELEVCDFLREHGFAVDPQVGCSDFRIDLALKRPDSSEYVLAIECDGATYHSSKNARDRDRLRQEVLEQMGWKFYRIWSTDWFRNNQSEKKRLLQAARNAVKRTTAQKKEN